MNSSDCLDLLKIGIIMGIGYLIIKSLLSLDAPEIKYIYECINQSTKLLPQIYLN